MQRVGVLNGKNITHDKDFTAGLLASITPGVMEGFDIQGSGAGAQIQPGKALIEVERVNGDNIMVFFESTDNVPMNLLGTKKVFIEIDQAKINDGSGNAENGTGIGEIKTDSSYPSDNYIPLYSISSGTPTDEREGVKSKLLRKGIGRRKLLLTDGNGDEIELGFGTSGQVLTSIGVNGTPVWTSPAVDIHGLVEKTTLHPSDELILSDNQNSWINKKFKFTNLFANTSEINGRTNVLKIVKPDQLKLANEDSLGVFTDKSRGVNHLASTAGLVVGYSYPYSGNNVVMECYVGPSSPASIKITTSHSLRGYSEKNGFMFPVPKGYYWRVDVSSAGYESSLKFIPFK